MVLRILYNDPNAGRCIFRLTEKAVQQVDAGQRTMADIAAYVVPTGQPYAIIDSSEITEDWATRDAWFVDDADLTDGVGGVEGVPAHGLFKPLEEETA